MTTKLVTYVTKAKEGTFSYRKSDETEFQSSKMEGQERPQVQSCNCLGCESR